VDKSLETLSINTIRTLAMDAIQKAKSGHPGMPMGAAPMAYVLWQRHLRHNPADPAWPDRDRFVLSGGHASMLLYALLHLTGYDLGLEDIKQFRQWESIAPGHPEAFSTPGVEATSGPLGQGIANAVGMAVAERRLAHRFNGPDHAVVDHRTYAICSDGDMMEGVSAEASSLAGHWKLGKLVCLYDSNGVTLDGPTSITFSTEDVAGRYEAYGWQVLEVVDGDTDTEAIHEALLEAEEDRSRPSLVIVRTTIAFGSPNKAGTSDAHGSPLGEEEVALTKKALGWDPDKTFHVPAEALAHFREAVGRGRRAQDEWEERFRAWSHANPGLAEEWRLSLKRELPQGWDADLPSWEAGETLATRVAAGKAMNAIATRVPCIMGGDADLSCSTKTAVTGARDFDGQTGEGRNLRFGVREHAMGGIVNGMAYHGGLRPYASTFLVFCDYMRPAVRLAALNRLPVVYAWTHDSIWVGEDGPTHQPIEHVMSLRVIPNLRVVRPADANEAAEAWAWAVAHDEGPVALILTRQKVTTLDRSRLAPASGLRRGAYVLADPKEGEPRAVIIATGSEVAVALEAHDLLSGEGIPTRLVSMPCWETFEAQTREYRDSVLPPSIRARVSVEAGVTMGWRRWIGGEGVAIGIDRFGASAPGKVNAEKFGFTPQRVAEAVRSLLE